MAFAAFVDELLEQCIRRHLNLKSTLETALPAAAKYLGAAAAIIRTRNEEFTDQTFSWGIGPALDVLHRPDRPAARVIGKHLWVSRPLEVAGLRVGMTAFAFGPQEDAKERSEQVRIFCEELDAILWNIQMSNYKQNLVERLTRALTRPIFPDALDDAVSVLREAIPFERLVVLHVDESDEKPRALHYRVYADSPRSRRARCTHHSSGRPLKALDEAIRDDGLALLSPGRRRVARALDLQYAIETLFIAGITQTQHLGQLTISTASGLDNFGRDLLKVFANAVSQRLIDYRRERRHLAQYFSRPAIDALLRHANYQKKYLAPRSAKVALLYADLNSFTRLCEALGEPAKIGSFIDAWSSEAVRIIWAHHGVFDKMVGDCVIAIFGPPFFRRSAKDNVSAALRTAQELQTYTCELGSRPEYSRLVRKAGLPGMGVAIGVHLCPAAVGLFGPNRDYTAFSSGMNQTARLQAVAGFRETLVMDTARRAVRANPKLRFKGPLSAKVKNVTQPLRYYKLTV
ncbi:MAG: adenylate/guanylate cyclase domain-containing protein [Elusimicrobiota bacterium]